MGRPIFTPVGERFNKLVVLSYAGQDTRKGNSQQLVRCRCDCGNEKTLLLYTLKNGYTKSCGCLIAPYHAYFMNKYGVYHKKINAVYSCMMRRCYNPDYVEFHNYGGRGITVSDKWKNNFIAFYEWCIKNGWDEKLQIDRIDNNGNYEPDNCRFVTSHINTRNRRSNVFIEFNGERKILKDWATQFGINVATLELRLRVLKWGVEKAFTTPVITTRPRGNDGKFCAKCFQ